jgi:phosphoribosylanthranilate isomerase
MRIKVCGITRLEDAQLAVELGASAIGFILWPESPRFIDAARAKTIIEALPPFVTPVGVFVDQPRQQVNDIAMQIGLGAVQLHGNETPEYCGCIRHRVVRAIGLTPMTDLASLRAWPASITLLLDAHDPEKHGGTGRTVNWALATRVAAMRRTILSGGLRPDNVGAAVDAVRPYAIDVSSGVEARPGVKDPERMRAFFHAVDAVRG